jgi:DNA repair protein RadD
MRTATQSAVLEIIKHGAKRKKWLIFCAGIQHADEVATAIAEHGIDIVTVHSKMSEEQRDENIARFRTGTARAIVNMGVLTTGFNCPAVDLLAVLRPTKSPGLWCQILGRGTRPAPGKTDCLVLDFGRNTERLGPINAIQPPPKPGQKQGGIAPMKICGNEDCRTWIHASAKVCPQCGYEFPVSEKLERTASSLKLIADGKPKSSEWRKVDAVNYSVHRSKTGRDTLLVLYRCGFDSFREYICIGYPGFPGKKAQKWIEWRTCELINTPAEALKAKLKKPSEILINFAEKWPRVTDCKF